MNDTFDYIMRFAAVLFAYCCALLAAGWFLAAILFRTLGVDALMQDFAMMAGDGDAGSLWAVSFWSSVFVGGFVLAAFAGSFSFLPAAVLILLAEARGYCSSLFYCVTGALIGLAAAGTIIPFRGADSGSDMPLWIAAMAGAGIVGGFVYWAVAGRKAGRLNRPTGE